MQKLDIKYKILFSIFTIICLAIIIKLYILSIARYEYYDKLSTENTIKTEVLIPVRGQIIDRLGEPLAINELGFSLALKTRLKNDKLDEILNEIKLHITDIDEHTLKQDYKKYDSIYRRTPVTIIDFIPYAQMQTIYSALFLNKDIIISPTTKRFYPNTSSASHIIGYIGASNKEDIINDPISRYTKIIGKQGLENEYNTFLQGKLGYRKIQVNQLNQRLRVLEYKQATSNNNMQVSLDMRLQETLDSLFKDKNGAGIIMDVRTGEILASGSYPEYNINDFVGGISHAKYDALLSSPYKPLINKLINGIYPPGSVIKMGMALAFLQYANINELTSIETPYQITLGGHRFRDWKWGGHGSSDLVKALRESVDVYFYKLSQIAGINNMHKVLVELGFGEKTGIDLPYESEGIVPNPEWKMKSYSEPWYLGDTVLTSIGQGNFLATPMQVARYVALIAGGKLVTPHYALKLGDDKTSFEPADVLSDFQKSKLTFLRQGMYEACSKPSGTAYRQTRGTKVPFACKTGTAQVVSIPQDVVKRKKEDEMEYFQRSQAWMSIFVPYKNPKYVVTLLVEHGGVGGRNGPLMVKIVNKMQELGYLDSK